MKVLSLRAALAATLLLSLASCGDGADLASVDRVTVAELQAALTADSAVAVDVRGDVSWTAGHIPVALHIPFEEIDARHGELPAGKKIVTYCS